MKISHPDEKRADTFAEHVISILIDNGLCDKRAASDESLKNILGVWLTFLPELLKEDLDDTHHFIETVVLNQRVLVVLAKQYWQKGSLDGISGDSSENAEPINYWNPIIIPMAAFYLTDDNQIPGKVYSDYWELIAAKQTTELFPRLPLDTLFSQLPVQDEKALRIFTADMTVLTHTLLTDYYEAVYRLGFNRDDPEKFAKQLLETWENAWVRMNDTGTQVMNFQTLQLYFLLQNLGYLLANQVSIDFAKKVAVIITELTKNGWHGICQKIDT